MQMKRPYRKSIWAFFFVGVSFRGWNRKFLAHSVSLRAHRNPEHLPAGAGMDAGTVRMRGGLRGGSAALPRGSGASAPRTNGFAVYSEPPRSILPDRKALEKRKAAAVRY
jgi:hypothetical protein